MTAPSPPTVAIIGAGPAGLMAAEVLSAKGIRVDIFEAMPSPARKFLMAGKSGLNITHTEPRDAFTTRYTPTERLAPYIERFDNLAIAAWMDGLGIPYFAGSSGRVFPKAMKASPLLRAWLARLNENGVRLHTRHRWTGWSGDALTFDTQGGVVEASPDATLFAMGGASWKRLGSDGNWAGLLADRGVEIFPFQSSNCGVKVEWSDYMVERYAGLPVKTVALMATGPDGDVSTRSEFVITKTGLEGGGIYNLSATIRDQIADYGEGMIYIDLAPDISEETLVDRLNRASDKNSFSSKLRKVARLSPAKMGLLRECTGIILTPMPEMVAQAIKNVPVRIKALADIDGAISTVGGVSWRALDEQLQLTSLPDHYCAGEMINWDAPTGGYLLTACFATGRAAAEGILSNLGT